MRFLLLTTLLLSFAAADAAALSFKDLSKLADKDSKERKLLSGLGEVVSSGQDIDYQAERTIGENLALEGLQRYGTPVKNEKLQKYVNLVGNALAANSQRPEISYQFVVVENDLYNAFACPGGIIFVSAALFNLIETESELAAILAHEIGHVGYKHALKSTKRSQFLSGLGKITAASMGGKDGKKVEELVGDLQNVVFDKGLDKNMEFEADAIALDTAFRTGYATDGLIRVLRKLQKLESKEKGKKGSWFSTHPPLKDRIAKLEKEAKKYKGGEGLATVAGRFNQYRNLAR